MDTSIVFDEYADHPRYGKRPRVTGANPQNDFQKGVILHWHSQQECRFPNTAIEADANLQIDAMYPITHYYDVKRQCVECRRKFIFFAQEQKHWYEVLQFSINADCVRCVSCRKQKQYVVNRRIQYEVLLKSGCRTEVETLILVDCCLTLIESSEFGLRSLETARMLLNSIPGDSALRKRDSYHALVFRSEKLLKESG